METQTNATVNNQSFLENKSSVTPNQCSTGQRLGAFSYYEFYDHVRNIYIGKYPSDKTDAPLKQIPDLSIRNGKILLGVNPTARDVENIADALEQNTFGFYDNVGYLCENLIANAKSKLENGQTEIILEAGAVATHLSSLYIKSATREKNHDALIVGSHLDKSFEVKLYARAQTAIQEAMDLFLLYVKETPEPDGSRKIMTTLGYKKRSERLWIGTKTELRSVLKIGMHGHLPGPGEHLESDEKKEVNEMRARFAKEISQRIPVKLSDVSRISSRAAAEEAGVNLDLEKKVGRFCVGVHDRDGRDPRYWTFNRKTSFGLQQFGYKRPSYSVLIAVIIPCKEFPTELGEPTDTVECAKAQLVDFKHLCNEFKNSNKCKYPPAFPAHVEQLQLVQAAVPAMLNAYFA